LGSSRKCPFSLFGMAAAQYRLRLEVDDIEHVVNAMKTINPEVKRSTWLFRACSFATTAHTVLSRRTRLSMLSGGCVHVR